MLRKAKSGLPMKKRSPVSVDGTRSSLSLMNVGRDDLRK